MVTVVRPQPDSFSRDVGLRMMPEAAHEVPATLLLMDNGRKVPIGNVREDYDNPADVLVLLGTKVSDGYPSSIGFRILLRTDIPKNQDSASIGDNYHVVSCKFDPRVGVMSYKHATKQDKQELAEALGLRKSLEEDLTAGTDQSLYRMDFSISDTDGFLISRHKPDLHTQNDRVRKIKKLLPVIAYSSKLSLFFIADILLGTHLDNAIKQNGVGILPPSWKIALPDSAVSQWPSNVQTQMVAGSIDIYNVLLRSLREKPLQDGPGTLVNGRPEATQFRTFVYKNYPNVRREASNKVHPVMLDVSEGAVCVELPFGASMLNRSNTYAAINALHGLLAAGIALDHIGIATLYPAQVEAYQDALNRCHRYAPERGYNLVQVGLIEKWIGRTVSIAIVDLVRTSNATGNLGYLSQANRLKVLLTLHRNGLIIVGDRGCTIIPHGSVTSAKLDKVLQWFVDNGRIVPVSAKGLPQISEKVRSIDPKPRTTRPTIPNPFQISTTDPSLSSSSSSLSHGRTSSLSSVSTLRTARKYVGIPGLEHLGNQASANETFGVSVRRRSKANNLEAVHASFVRQGFVEARETSRTPEVLAVASSKGAELAQTSHCHQVLLGPKGGSDNTKLGAGSKPDAQTSSGFIIAREEDMHNQQTRDQSIETLARRPEEAGNLSTKEVATKGTNPFHVPSNRSKAQGLPSPPTPALKNMDIAARFEDVTNRFKVEFGPDLYQNILKDSRSKRSNVAEVGIPAAPLASLTGPGNAVSSTTALPMSPSKENVKPTQDAEDASPQRLGVRPAVAVPLQQQTVSLRPHMRAMSKQSRQPSQQPAPKEMPSKKAPQSVSPARSSNGYINHKEDAISSQGCKGRPAADLGIVEKAEQKPDLFQKKYRGIRSVFANMANIPRDQSAEDQLFRLLAEAFMDEDFEAFEHAYTELLSMAARVQLGGFHGA